MAKLVAIGDSLTQGFQSLAINKTSMAYPALIAESLNVPVPEFRVPDFKGKGGLPLNIEWIARKLEGIYGENINIFEWPFATDTILDLMDEVEDYWERGKGSAETKEVRYHNLAVWGFEVADAYNITPKLCRKKIKETKDDWFKPPSEPRLRTAYRVLNPSQNEENDIATQISIAKEIKNNDGEIDNLIVWLGANNCLGTVARLKIIETQNDPPGPNSYFTLWKPAAFKKEYDALVKNISGIGAKNIYVGTVPHVTIPPLTRGIMKNKGRLPKNKKYFDYYTHFFIQDKKFDPERDNHLTGDDAKKIDDYIDEYNHIIKQYAQDNGWHVVDICMLLDKLAVRRNHGMPRYTMPSELHDLNIRFFEIEPNGKIKNGGLISLDGIHPTTCGYAIIAQEFIEAMRGQNPSIRNINFSETRYLDTLVSRPPLTLNDIFGMLKFLEKTFHVSRILSNRF